MLEQAALPYRTDLPQRVEVTTWEKEGKQFLFVFNNDQAVKNCLLDGEQTELQPFEMKILERTL